MLFSFRPRRSAFTLLEIALVIAIVILLILAIIPAFRGKRAERRFPLLPPEATPTPAAFPPVPLPLSTPTPATPAPPQ
jgi:hypothetical protein